MSLTVKAYLVKPNEPNPEIRRFAVDQDVSTSYAYLQEKVNLMFPALKNKHLELFWKDNENDLIAFSSDDELTEALGFVSDGVFKVYIKEKASGSGPDAKPEPDVRHPGVVCDGCEKPVCGYRFKCVVCPDYDLCSGCERQGIHSEHNMIRLTDPMPGFMGFGGAFCPPFPGGPFGPGCPPPPYGGPHGPHGGPQGPHPHSGPHPGPHGPWGRGRGGHGGWRRMMRQWRQWMDCAEESPEKKSNSGKTEKDQKQKSDNKGEKPNAAEGKDYSSDEGEASPTEDFLKNIGENVAAMLDPLGIDVEVDVEHNGNRKRCNQGPSPFGPWGWGVWGGGRGRHCGRGRGAHCPRGQRCGTESENKDDSTTTPKSDEPVVEMETGETQNKEDVTIPKSQAGDTMETTQAPSNGETGEIPIDSGSQSPERDWTIIDSRNGQTEGSSQTTEGATNGIYPEIPQTGVPQTENADPTIVNAMDHMNAMGFADDGGWLTRLLEVTGGDINKALDAIRANRTK